MSEQGEKKQTGKGILVIGIVAIVVVAVLVGIIIFLVRSQNKPAEEEKRQVLVTEDNVEEVIQELIEQDEAEEVAPGYYTVTMTFEWHFKNGDEASYDAYVENAEGNTNDVYFDIVDREDESQVWYSSPVIPRGGVLKDIKLDRKLDAGQYSAVCIYHLVDEDQKPLSEVRMGLKIIVEG
jgi:Na+-transporting NADH:ubiquinone oxidoreductase subunit NqrC